MSTLGALADAESRMLAVLDELGPTGLVTTIPGLSAVGAAVIYGSRGRGRSWARRPSNRHADPWSVRTNLANLFSEAGG